MPVGPPSEPTIDELQVLSTPSWTSTTSVDRTARCPTTPFRPPPTTPARKPAPVRVGRETAGRRGKGVTTVWDLPLDDNGIRELAALLKQRCGTGGTVKDGKIEIQGEHLDRIAAELEKMGYKVKRSGG